MFTHAITAADIAMLEMCARRGVLYQDYAAEEEDVD